MRIALGAQPGDVMRLVLGRGMLITGSGVLIGLAGAFALTRLVESLLIGVSATDPWSFAFVVLVLAAIALAASFIPARRAMKIDPLVALREE